MRWSPRSRATSSSPRRASRQSGRRITRCCSRCSGSSSSARTATSCHSSSAQPPRLPRRRPSWRCGARAEAPRVSATPILETKDLGLDIGGATILSGVGLDVREGELLAVIGPNGAGKTTLFNLVSGLLRPTSGRIELAGVDITDLPTFRRTRAGLGRTFQVSNVFPLLDALENVRLAAEAALGGTMRIWRQASRVREAVDKANWALDRVGLTPRARVIAGGLAHGDKRKLELAMVLAGDSRVILLDEPMAGVSMEDVPELVELIRSVHVDEGKTVLLVEHHMEVVTGLAQRIAVLHHGNLLAVDTPDAIMRNETVQRAYLGEPI